MKREDIKLSQIVYVDNYSDDKQIYKGTIWRINDNNACVQMNWLVRMDSDGNETIENDVPFRCLETHDFEDIYATAKEICDMRAAKKEERIKRCCDRIKDINDLLRFPIEHPFGIEEYTDYEAIEVYKIMCKKIAQLDIDCDEI